jgi:hypothetical protein
MAAWFTKVAHAGLSRMVGLKVDFDLQITLMASSLYRLLVDKIGGLYRHAQAKKLFHNLLDVSATVTTLASVQLAKHSGLPVHG